MNWIKRNVNYVASVAGAEVEFDEDAVKALLRPDLTLKHYNLNLVREKPGVMLVYLSATGADGGGHIVATTIDKPHFRVGEGYAMSELWKQAIKANDP